jgi:hypothetical protein
MTQRPDLWQATVAVAGAALVAAGLGSVPAPAAAAPRGGDRAARAAPTVPPSSGLGHPSWPEIVPPQAAGPAVETFGIDYIVTVPPDDSRRVRVTWVLAGIDEIRLIRLVLRHDGFSNVRASGRLVREGSRLTWRPGSPYARLSYTVDLTRRRGDRDAHDSFAAADWLLTRAQRLFPETRVTFHPGERRPPEARARLLLRLPAGWESAVAAQRLGHDAYRIEEPGKRFDRPRGWMLFGRITRQTRTLGGTEVTVATTPGSALDVPGLFGLYRRVLPLVTDLLGRVPPRLVVVSAGDPMWRGGLSGEDSLFVHGGLPLRSGDRTSTYVHELVHTVRPLRPAADARWIAEGLAEYYALELPRRVGRLGPRGFSRGLRSFARSGRWDLDFTQSADQAVLNNSAPLVFYALDREIRRASGGRQSLDDVVRALGALPRPLTTAAFIAAARGVTGTNLGSFFRRHVFLGIRPPIPEHLPERPAELHVQR